MLVANDRIQVYCSLCMHIDLEKEELFVEGVQLTAHSGIGIGSLTGFLSGGENRERKCDSRFDKQQKKAHVELRYM